MSALARRTTKSFTLSFRNSVRRTLRRFLSARGAIPFLLRVHNFLTPPFVFFSSLRDRWGLDEDPRRTSRSTSETGATKKQIQKRYKRKILKRRRLKHWEQSAIVVSVILTGHISPEPFFYVTTLNEHDVVRFRGHGERANAFETLRVEDFFRAFRGVERSTRPGRTR